VDSDVVATRIEVQADRVGQKGSWSACGQRHPSRRRMCRPWPSARAESRLSSLMLNRSGELSGLHDFVRPGQRTTQPATPSPTRRLALASPPVLEGPAELSSYRSACRAPEVPSDPGAAFDRPPQPLGTKHQ
jgi:hypothetical protein